MEIFQLLQVPSHCLFGLMLTIFYKKDFTFQGENWSSLKTLFKPAVLWFILFWVPCMIKPAFLSWDKDLPTLLVLLCNAVTIVYAWEEFVRLATEEKTKAVVLSFALVLVSIFNGDHLACIAVLCALTQLLRWPVYLKNRLREMRIIFGPVYTILATGACIQSRVISTLLIASAFSALVASVFLRPDNGSVLAFLGLPIPSPQRRKFSHGFLMFSSMTCDMVYLPCASDLPGLLVSGTFLFFILNTLFYLFVAEFPRKLIAWCYRRCFNQDR